MNERIGNYNADPSRSGQRVGGASAFKSLINLHHLGEQYYLCSSLTGHANVMPSGLQTVLCEIPVKGFEEKHFDAISRMPSLDKTFVDVGNQTFSMITFYLRDFDGTLLPMGEFNWTATLAFGYVE